MSNLGGAIPLGDCKSQGDGRAVSGLYRDAKGDEKTLMVRCCCIFGLMMLVVSS